MIQTNVGDPRGLDMDMLAGLGSVTWIDSVDTLNSDPTKSDPTKSLCGLYLVNCGAVIYAKYAFLGCPQAHEVVTASDPRRCLSGEFIL